MEELLFEIISNVGTARSNYIEAIQLAKEGKFEEAEELMKAGQKSFVDGHKRHAELLTKEAQGDSINGGLLLIHTEDQLMSAEAFSILSNEFIDLYKKLYNKNLLF